MKKLIIVFLLFFVVIPINSDTLYEIKGRGIKKIEKNNYLYILSKDNYLNLYKNGKKEFAFSGYSRTNYYKYKQFLYIWETKFDTTELHIFNIKRNFKKVNKIQYNNRIEYVIYIENKLYLFFINGQIIETKELVKIPKNYNRKNEFPFWEEHFYNIRSKIIIFFNKKFYKIKKNKFIKVFEIPSNYFEIFDKYIIFENKASNFEIYNLEEKKKYFTFRMDQKWKNANLIRVLSNKGKPKIIYALNNKILSIDNRNKKVSEFRKKVLYVDSKMQVTTENDDILKDFNVEIDDIKSIIKINGKYFITAVNYTFFQNQYYVFKKNDL